MRKMIKSRKFKLHFNRINMQRGKPGVWTIHRSDRCIPARNVKCYVDVETTFKPTGAQPRAYLSGEGVVIDCGDNDYVILTPQLAYALVVSSHDKGMEVRFA